LTERPLKIILSRGTDIRVCTL